LFILFFFKVLNPTRNIVFIYIFFYIYV
jgi:hypothetical protein